MNDNACQCFIVLQFARFFETHVTPGLSTKRESARVLSCAFSRASEPNVSVRCILAQRITILISSRQVLAMDSLL